MSSDRHEPISEELIIRLQSKPMYQSPPQDSKSTVVDVAKGTPHQTLGQIADRIQEQARAAKTLNSEESMGEDEGEDDDHYPDEDEIGGQTESTGRWTKGEHDLFLEGLKKYGKVSFEFLRSFQ